jgi:hypothetical protein
MENATEYCSKNHLRLYTACNFEKGIMLNLLHIPYIMKQGREYILFTKDK